ncbi:transposase [Azospirillum brasilense]|nr:transposase [Azospirillum brasilense]NUB32919.1 transposase [Azospirillum brasilense]RIW02326.1 IS4/IS5 family transposase [Azospirillum brasilense]
MQWRAIGRLSGIPFGTLYTLFARWTRLGLWRRLLDRLRRTWRLACGDTAEPSTVVIDSRTCPSAPSCFARGVDGGKKIRGIKIQLGFEKYGIPLAIDASPANVHDTKGIVPVLRQIAGRGFRGPAISDLGYRRERLAKAAAALGITVRPIARGRDGLFIPTEIAWVVERSFSWITRWGHAIERAKLYAAIINQRQLRRSGCRSRRPWFAGVGARPRNERRPEAGGLGEHGTKGFGSPPAPCGSGAGPDPPPCVWTSGSRSRQNTGRRGRG